MKSLEEVPESVKDPLRMSRGSMEMFESVQKQLVQRLLSERALEQRVERLMRIRGIGPITALTWALEVDDPRRFSSIGNAVSYCGLTSAFRSSAGKEQRGPISKQRNARLQTYSHGISMAGFPAPGFPGLCHFAAFQTFANYRESRRSAAHSMTPSSDEQVLLVILTASVKEFVGDRKFRLVGSERNTASRSHRGRSSALSLHPFLGKSLRGPFR
jgi:Transposase IS116/IS110/IS902 family